MSPAPSQVDTVMAMKYFKQAIAALEGGDSASFSAAFTICKILLGMSSEAQRMPIEKKK